MHFESDLIDAVFCGIFGFFLPIRDKHVVPLIIEDMEKILRPRAGDPVGCFIFGRTAGAAREGDDHRDFEFVGKHAGAFEIFMEFSGDFFIGMDGVAVCGQSGNLDIVFLKEILKGLQFALIGEKLLAVAMALAGKSAGTDFDSFDAQAFDIGKHIFKRTVIKRNGDESYFHGNYFLSYFLDRIASAIIIHEVSGNFKYFLIDLTIFLFIFSDTACAVSGFAVF